MPPCFAWTSRSPSETLDMGDRVGQGARPGQFLALFGPIGSGKTHFVKGLARGLGIRDWDLVASPTFTLAAKYEGRLPLIHVDAYRLAGPGELLDLGFEEWISEEGVTALEWADRAGDFLPGDRLEIHMAHRAESVREIAFSPVGPSSEKLLRSFYPGNSMKRGGNSRPAGAERSEAGGDVNPGK